jgi:hypothetical protein
MEPITTAKISTAALAVLVECIAPGRPLAWMKLQQEDEKDDDAPGDGSYQIESPTSSGHHQIGAVDPKPHWMGALSVDLIQLSPMSTRPNSER